MFKKTFKFLIALALPITLIACTAKAKDDIKEQIKNNTCDSECILNFDELENVILYIHLENGWARLKFASEILPKYFEIHGYLRNQLDLNVSDSQLFKKVVDLFNDYGNKHISSDNTFKQYTVNYLTDVRLKVKRFQITDFQATPPPKPTKEN